ncbi:MAG TPA: methyltransferase domain-containing protein [Acidimicrobiia bacterium]|nr:methyltransferase domain-containing protein [Acidimicrobiia bacterium]
MSKAIGDYVIPPDWGEEQERLRLLGEWRDPITLARLEALGLGEGWHCLEVGVGGGSTARALAARVGPTGRVTAADINPAFLSRLEGEPNIGTRLCDVRVHDFPAGSFDLIHTRLVLEHLPDRLAVMKRMVDWLRPGGWVFFEEPDTAAAVVSPNRLWVRHMQGYASAAGYDVNTGRMLPSEVGTLGLVDLGMQIDTAAVQGGSDLARWYALTIDAVRESLVSEGAVTSEELDQVIVELADPALLEPGMTFVGVWGRKP